MLRYPDPINASGSASAQQKSGCWQLDEACNLGVNSEALIDPYDLEIVKERLLWCVLHSTSVSKSCSTHVSADSEDVKMDFEIKNCLSRILQEQGYHRTAKDVRLSRATTFLTISRFCRLCQIKRAQLV
jgi:hypothetical protein